MSNTIATNIQMNLSDPIVQRKIRELRKAHGYLLSIKHIFESCGLMNYKIENEIHRLSSQCAEELNKCQQN
jgi:hypothetical protein